MNRELKFLFSATAAESGTVPGQLSVPWRLSCSFQSPASLAGRASSDGDASVTSSGVQGLLQPSGRLVVVHLVNYQPGVLPCRIAVPLTQESGNKPILVLCRVASGWPDYVQRRSEDTGSHIQIPCREVLGSV